MERVKGGQSDDKTNHKNGSLGLFSTFRIIGYNNHRYAKLLWHGTLGKSR